MRTPKDKSLPYLATDLRLEALVPYVRGQRPIIFTVERERDVRAVARFVSEMKVKGIIVGGQEAWKAAGRAEEERYRRDLHEHLQSAGS
jgi:hypothetical protein